MNDVGILEGESQFVLFEILANNHTNESLEFTNLLIIKEFIRIWNILRKTYIVLIFNNIHLNLAFFIDKLCRDHMKLKIQNP